MIQFSIKGDNIEKALKFLAIKINDFSNNSKPVVFHSIRVGLGLLELNYSEEIVIGGLLHDLIEDSLVTEFDIEHEFGKEITKIVIANTFNKNLCKDEQFVDCFNRCRIVGIQAIIVKAYDIFDNSFYYELKNDNVNNFLYVIKKMKYFIELNNELLINESKLYKLLIDRYNSIYNKEFNDIRIVKVKKDFILDIKY